MLNDDFIKGAWFAFDEVLSWINTQDRKLIDKDELYRHVMQLRPIALLRHSQMEAQDAIR